MLINGKKIDLCNEINIKEEQKENLILVSKKEKAHYNYISVLLNIGNGFIASGSGDKTKKIIIKIKKQKKV